MSSAIFPAAKVAEACNALLARRADRIKREREPLIQRAMQPRVVFGFTVRKARSREDAIAYLNANSDGLLDPWCRIERKGSESAATAEMTLCLAEAAMREHGNDSATMVIDDRTAWIIF
jgi:hypothetical protein